MPAAARQRGAAGSAGSAAVSPRRAGAAARAPRAREVAGRGVIAAPQWLRGWRERRRAWKLKLLALCPVPLAPLGKVDYRCSSCTPTPPVAHGCAWTRRGFPREGSRGRTMGAPGSGVQVRGAPAAAGERGPRTPRGSPRPQLRSPPLFRRSGGGCPGSRFLPGMGLIHGPREGRGKGRGRGWNGNQIGNGSPGGCWGREEGWGGGDASALGS